MQLPCMQVLMKSLPCALAKLQCLCTIACIHCETNLCNGSLPFACVQRMQQLCCHSNILGSDENAWLIVSASSAGIPTHKIVSKGLDPGKLGLDQSLFTPACLDTVCIEPLNWVAGLVGVWHCDASSSVWIHCITPGMLIPYGG